MPTDHRRNIAVLLFLQLCFDGYDIAVLSFVAPVVVHEWALASLGRLGVVFSASLAGMAIGSVAGGWATDRFGAKATLVANTALAGLFTLGTAAVASLEEMVILRALTGIALGGSLPAVIRLMLDTGGDERRATRFVLVNLGVSVGAALPGLVVAALLPAIGWRGTFVTGGVAALAYAIILVRTLPVIVARTGPAQTMERRPGIGALFVGPLKRVTPLLWFVSLINGAMLYLIVSWLPTLAVRAGMTVAQAGFAAAAFQVGGIVAGLAAGRAFDRIGFASLAGFLIGAWCLFALVGLVTGKAWLMPVATFLLGVAMFASLFGLNYYSGALYPVAIRGSGAGANGGSSRIGSLAGPLIGVWLAGQTPGFVRYAIFGLPLLLAAAATASIYRSGHMPPAD